MPTIGLVGALLTAGPTPLPITSPGPLRVVELATGEQISAELLDSDEKSMKLRLRGGAVVELPRAGVTSIAHQPGWRDVIYETGDQQEHDEKPARKTLTPSAPLTAGRFGWTVIPNDAGSASGQVQFTFQRGEVLEQFRLHFEGDGQDVRISGDVSFAKHPLPSTKDSTHWSVYFDADRVEVLAGDQLFASGAGTGSLTRVEVERDANASISFDNLLLQARDRKKSSSVNELPPLDDTRDCLTFFDGNRLYGQVLRANGRQIVWKFGEREVINRWSDVRSIQWRVERLKQPPRVSGQIVRVRFRPWLHLPAHTTGDELEVAIRQRDDGDHAMRHPLLGPFACPADQVAEVTPIFIGTRSVVLERPIAFGGKRTAWKGSYESAPADQPMSWFLRLTTTGLEPSGPKTFLGSPHLRALRDGRMTTELWWNNQRVAVLNEFLSRHRAESEIRIPIPNEVIQSGANAWEIRQMAHTPNGTEFDRCKIGPVYLESESLDTK